MKKIFNWQVLLGISLIALTTEYASAGAVSFQKEYTYQAGALDNKVSSRVIAWENLKSSLFGEISSHLEGKREVEKMRLKKKHLTALIASMIRINVIEEKWDKKTYYMKAGVSFNPDDTAKSVAILSRNKRDMIETAEVRKKAAWFLARLEKLRLKHDSGGDNKVALQYKEAVRGLSAIDFFESGAALVNAGASPKAIEMFTTAIKLNPSYEKFYVFRGNAYGEIGDNQRAVKDITKALKLTPKYVNAYVSRGNAYARSKNFRQAINDYSMAIKLNPKHAEAYSYRGVAYGALAKEQQALEDFSQAIKLNPEYEKAYFYRGLAYAESKHYHKALEDFNKAIELNPAEAEAYFNRGRVYGLLGDTYKAVEDLRKAARLGDKAAQSFLKTQKIEW